MHLYIYITTKGKGGKTGVFTRPQNHQVGFFLFYNFKHQTCSSNFLQDSEELRILSSSIKTFCQLSIRIHYLAPNMQRMQINKKGIIESWLQKGSMQRKHSKSVFFSVVTVQAEIFGNL